jgi:hypothetical protein
VDDLRTFVAIVDDFGVALGLGTNFSKCLSHLIRCLVDVVAQVDQELGVPGVTFPTQIPRPALVLRKPTATQLQYLVDAVTDRLPSWRASMLNRACRLELVRSTLELCPCSP